MTALTTVGVSQPGWPPYDIDYTTADYSERISPVTGVITLSTTPVNADINGLSTGSATATGNIGSNNATSGLSTGSATATGNIGSNNATSGLSTGSATATGVVDRTVETTIVNTTGYSQPSWPRYLESGDQEYFTDEYFLYRPPVIAEVLLLALTDGLSTGSATATGNIESNNATAGLSTGSATATGAFESNNATAGLSTGSATATGVTINGDIPELSISTNILITEVADILDIYAGR